MVSIVVNKTFSIIIIIIIIIIVVIYSFTWFDL